MFRELWKRWDLVEKDAVVFAPRGMELSMSRRLRHSSYSGFRPRRCFWALEMERALHRSGSDLFVSTYYTAPRRNDIPQILFVYDLIHERFLNRTLGDRRFIRKKGALVRQAQHIIAISNTTKQDILQYYPSVSPERIHVLGLAPSECFKPVGSHEETLHPLSGRPYILHVGRRGQYKNFAALLDTYIAAHRIHQAFDLVVVTQNPWRKDEATKIRRAGLQERIHLMPNVSDADLPRYYQHARAFVLPSLYEGFGLPLLEAFACGTPVIAYCAPSLIEVGGDAALYFSGVDEDGSLKERLGQICFDDALRDEYSARGIGRATRFSWERFTRGFKHVVEKWEA